MLEKKSLLSIQVSKTSRHRDENLINTYLSITNMSISSSYRYTFIDLFAGCGSISLGLSKAGWKGIFAIEKSKMAFGTLKHNLIDKENYYEWPQWLPQTEHDINHVVKTFRRELEQLNGSISLIVGGPPCQGFSLAGRRNEHDERNLLVNAYIEFIDIVRPHLLFFENVKGFTASFRQNNSSGKTYSKFVLEKLLGLGYDVNAETINFGEFGVPQRRKRFILVGAKSGNPDLFFKKLVDNSSRFLESRGLRKKVTLREAISDLEKKHGEIKSIEYPGFKHGVYGETTSNYQRLLRKGNSGNRFPDSHRFPNHRPETVRKFLYILNNSPRDTNVGQEIKRKFQIRKNCIIPLDGDKQSPTLTTLPDDYIHYSESRILTVREYARIQSFDDTYEFKGKYTTGGQYRRSDVPRYTQVGNAVPPLFMEQCGGVLKEMA